jgi:imidazolonepropionase-like amidohydrolase
MRGSQSWIRKWGTVEPGKIANLVLLKKSPLESMDAYDSIVAVWVHGTQVSREAGGRCE